MITINANRDKSFSDIRAIALDAWPVAYGMILSPKQIEYMMEMMYSEDALRKQELEKGHHFIIAYEDGTPVGFASFEMNSNGEPKSKIHKLYVLPTWQKKGVGHRLVNFIEKEARRKEQTSLILNVNRFNEARFFYEKIGFLIVSEEDIDIGNGFLMEDFVMEKKIETE